MQQPEQRAREILAQVLFNVGATKVASRIESGQHVPKYELALRAVTIAVTQEREELLHDLAEAVKIVQGSAPGNGYVDQDR